ncbi:hypothetical protein ACLZRP_27190, partial [Klebsiella pneumoniae]|uniref:hypothetical protein n=1 Tax=Klebsiella pneumoniae TaxID=573 RepID=UPI002181B574|nr:hypothetical protein NUBL22002_48610 [Klebsiella variicola]GKL89209.1 hypothetical protein NUKP64_09280 [Klebsiella variicola]
MVLPGGGCALPDLQDPLTGSHPVGPCKRSAAGQDIRHGILDFAGWRRTPYPAYKPKSPRVLELLKLPVLAASTSLRRSRQAGAARMDAG